MIWNYMKNNEIIWNYMKNSMKLYENYMKKFKRNA